MATLQQELLSHAYGKITGRATEDGGAKKTYGIWCHNLPGLIAVSGLAQATAFLDSKKDKPGFGWLLDDLGSVPGLPGTGSVLNRVRTASTPEYMLMTQRIQAALVYYKRFAESILGVSKEEATDREDLGK